MVSGRVEGFNSDGQHDQCRLGGPKACSCAVIFILREGESDTGIETGGERQGERDKGREIGQERQRERDRSRETGERQTGRDRERES